MMKSGMRLTMISDLVIYILPMMIFPSLLSLSTRRSSMVDGFSHTHNSHKLSNIRIVAFNSARSYNIEIEASEQTLELCEKIENVAKELWAGTPPIPTLSGNHNSVSDDGMLYFTEGEKELPDSVSYNKRAKYFEEEALKGCPFAQQSFALLMWNGFANVTIDERESAKFHAAAAYQNNLEHSISKQS